jgi:hypothetical protein
MDEQLSDREATIARYADGPNQLETAIAGLSEWELDIAESDGTWTIRLIVHHVADGDDIWKVFIKGLSATQEASLICSGIVDVGIERLRQPFLVDRIQHVAHRLHR